MFILCEKPGVARDFASALGAKAAGKGLYEGGGYTITHCIGHLFELYNPEDYDPKYKKWELAALPVLPERFQYRAGERVKEQAALVTRLLRECKGEALVATDAGREGELIARIALAEAGVADLSSWRRFWVSEALTPEVIRSGLERAKPLAEYDALAAEGFARQRSDWLVGINLTRLLSIGNPPPPFSVGRVQTAVLAAVAARNDEVKGHVKTPYRELAAEIQSAGAVKVTALLRNPNGKSAFFAEDGAYLDAAEAACKGAVIDKAQAEAKEKRQRPEKLLNITALQKKAFTRHGYKPDETLALAQNLYETHKCLSYPRTPSRVMGDANVDLFREKWELLKEASPLSAHCDTALIGAENKHIFDSSKLEDHHALIPLGTLPEGANEKERNIYTIVLESFFIVCMPDYIYNEKKLEFYIKEYIFDSTIRETIRAGWKAAVKQEDEEDAPESPAFDETAPLTLLNLSARNKFTEPKKEYSIDTLLSFMEHPKGEFEGKKLFGLGTPATRADIIKTLFARNYMHEDKKKLLVTDRGLFLLRTLLKNEHLAKMTGTSHTTEWEEKLSRDPAAFEKEIAEYVTICVTSGAAARETYQAESLGKCPLCGKPVREGKKSFSCSGWKDEPKCNFTVWKETCGAKVSETDAKLLLIGQKTPLKKCKKKDGTPFEAHFVLEGGKLVFNFPPRQGGKK